jgi:hypothetical protein
MRSIIRTAIALHLVALGRLSAQEPAWLVRGDTTGAPAGCSATSAIAAIDAFVAAMNRADSVELERVWAVRPSDAVSFTQNRFAANDEPVLARSIGQLVAYARARALHKERLTVQAVTFNGWRDGLLGFGPVYVRRTADDLGGKARYGTGQGVYECGKGLGKIGWGPRIELRPGQRMIESQAYPPDEP